MHTSFPTILYNDISSLIDAIFNEKGEAFDHCIDALSQQPLRVWANRHGLSPLVYHLTLNRPSPKLEQLKQQLKPSYLKATFSNTQFNSTCNKICQQLHAKGIDAMPLKGSYLTQFIYQDSALRQMSDVDILVKRKEAPLAYQLLTGKTFDPRLLKKTDHHLPPFTINGCTIEIHRHLFPIDAKYAIPDKDIWDQAQQIDSPYVGYVMDSSQLLVYLSTHIFYTLQRGGLRLSWFYDLKLLLEKDQDITENAIDRWVTAWDCKHPMVTTLSILATFYQSPSIDKVKKWIIPLTIAQQNQIDYFIVSSNQQDVAHSYALIWERLQHTSGLKNIIRFIMGYVITKDKPSWTLPIRVIQLGYRSLKMVWRKMTDKTNW